ncbi:hypothetical protein Bbelb_324260 [Branchiostoma belcheri]|nr:hypothetical protein Bbelb_324260 [Branchiostoma belcheri]
MDFRLLLAFGLALGWRGDLADDNYAQSLISSSQRNENLGSSPGGGCISIYGGNPVCRDRGGAPHGVLLAKLQQKAVLTRHLMSSSDIRSVPIPGYADFPSGAAGQNDIGLTIPDSVKAVIGDPVTLPATYTTKNQVISVAWFKLDRQDRAKRTLIYSYYPISGRGDVESAYAGRVELVGKASLRIKRTRLEDDGTYVLLVMVEGSGVADGFVTLSIMDEEARKQIKNNTFSFGKHNTGDSLPLRASAVPSLSDWCPQLLTAASLKNKSFNRAAPAEEKT